MITIIGWVFTLVGIAIVLTGGRLIIKEAPVHGIEGRLTALAVIWAFSGLTFITLGIALIARQT